MADDKPKNQTEAVKQHLLKYKKITSIEAINRYGATRLSNIIFNLRKRHGWCIKTIDKQVKDRFNTTTTIAVYRLIKPGD